MAFEIDRPFTFFFVRHGVTEANFKGLRCGGDVDVALTDLGCDQVYLLAKQIQRMDLSIGMIMASSLIRARQTALILSGVLGGMPIETDAAINERHLGEWNNRLIAETEDLLRENITPPGGESEAEFTARVAQGLEHLRFLFDRRPLVVSSKGVGRVLNSLLGGPGRLQVANGELVEFSAASAAGGGYALRVNRPHQV